MTVDELGIVRGDGIITEETKKGNKSFAIVLRGSPENFAQLVDLAKAAGLYVVYTKSSYLKLVVQEVPF